MIKEINAHLEKIGSIFRTEDGMTLTAYFGHRTFLVKAFPTVQDCYNFVMAFE